MAFVAHVAQKELAELLLQPMLSFTAAKHPTALLPTATSLIRTMTWRGTPIGPIAGSC